VRTTFLGALLLVLSGCAYPEYGLLVATAATPVVVGTAYDAAHPLVRIDDKTALQLRKDISVYRRDTPTCPAGVRLEDVTAVSCKRHFWDKGSEEDAIDQLRYRAFQLHAGAVVDVTCTAPEGLSLRKDCWWSSSCRGVLLRTSGPNNAETESAKCPSDSP
jgi:hypothetical protein